jgi:hypothetical protein
MGRVRSRRTLRIVAVVAALASAAAMAMAGPAAAARDLTDVPDNLTEQASSPNFLVHYTVALGDPNAITPEAAQRLLVTAERALGDSRSRLGLPQPLDDGDGRADVYVFATRPGIERGTVGADTRRDQTTGWIGIPPDATGDAFVVTHQIVHLQQLALYRPAGRILAEGSATWAPLHLYAGELIRLPDQAQFVPGDPLDCDDPKRCSRPGYASWQFFELLAERYDPQIVMAIYERSSALGVDDHRPHFQAALADVLAARGTTLPATFADFTEANLVGDYFLPGLARRRYAATEPSHDLATGRRSRRFRARGVTLDHLSAAFYRLRSGSDPLAAGVTRCTRARLRVRVDGPAGLEAPLYWAPFRPRRGNPRPLTLRNGSATFELPWSTCAGREVGVALHNPSPSVDARTFKLRIELAVPPASR